MNTMNSQPTGSMKGRTAIVTGSGQNIGKAIAMAFARAGANVVINGSRNQARVDGVVAEARALGVGAIGILADVGDAAAVKAMVDQAAAEFGSVDICVSNVSVRDHQPMLDITPDKWDQTLRSNLSSCFYLAHAAIPYMQKRGWGRIVHISGRDGFSPRRTVRTT